MTGRRVAALSLWEPWASLMAVGAKRMETRSWYTGHRGPLLICAAKKRDSDSLWLLMEPAFQRGLAPLVHETRAVMADDLAFGNAVALVDLLECVPTSDLGPGEIGGDAPFGDFSPGRFAWISGNLRRLDPIPVHGRQGLFSVTLPEGL